MNIDPQSKIDLHSHAPSVPFLRAIGAQLDDANARRIRMRLPLARRVSIVSRAGTAPCIDLRAVVALLDHAGSAAVYAAMPSIATATLELRIDLTASVSPDADVCIDARVLAAGCGSALASGQACCEGAAPFAFVQSRYIVGSGPGQAPADANYLAERDAAVARFAGVVASDAASFEAFLGGSASAEGWLLPFASPLVGSVTLPALHGGVVAAGLLQAVLSPAAGVAGALQLASLSVRYLRAAQAADTLFTARVVKAGKRAAFVDASAMQGDALVATAHALFG